MRSTPDHEDGPIPDKVFMVMSRPKSKVYYCFIKLSGISFIKIDTFIILLPFIAPAEVKSSVAKNRNPKYNA